MGAKKGTGAKIYLDSKHVSFRSGLEKIASIYGRLLPFNYSRYSEGIDLGQKMAILLLA